MRVTFLLDRPELGGGTKVVLQQADLLAARGHQTTVAAHGGRPAWSERWFRRGARYVDLFASGAGRLPSQDLLIATYWTTITSAEQLAVGPVAHFCQGFEEDLEHLFPQREAIRAAYRRPLPALVVAPHLGARLRAEFGRDSVLSPAPIDSSAGRRFRLGPRGRPWIALCGIFEAPVKGIRTGLEVLSALTAARPAGRAPRLLRISALPLSEPEAALFPAERYLSAVAPEVALAALAQCDLMLFVSTAGEGFGLPLLEAMHLGVPAVASRLPGSEWMVGPGGARLVDAGDVDGFQREASSLLDSPSAWRAQRRAGRHAARRFAPDRVGSEVERAVRWAIERAAETRRDEVRGA